MKPAFSFQADITGYDQLLRALASRFTRKSEEIDDLIQETYYRALANSDKFTEGTNLKAWLGTIMRNIFINTYNRNSLVRMVPQQPEEYYAHVYTDRNNSYRAFIADDIQNAINGVEADFTKPFLMYYEGFQYQEIADALQIPLGTVKSRIFSARKELQNRLKQAGIENSSVN